MKRKEAVRFFSAMVLISLTIALGGCSGDKQGDVSSSVITVGLPQDIEDSLDPHKAVAAGTREVLFNLFEGLVKPTSDGDYIPAIASDFTIAENGLVYTFALRENVKFHDGSTVSAEDVKFSLDKCADTSSGGPLVAAFANISEVLILDEKTIEIHLIEPDTEFLAVLTTAIIPASNPNPETNPIGTGPYAYESRSPQENFIVTRFNDYWGDKANIEKVIFKIIANIDTIVMDLEGGSFDMVPRIPKSQADELSDSFNILEGTMNLVQALYINHAAPPFDILEVRQALSYAVDPFEIMLMVSDGKGAEVGSSMFPAFTKYFIEDLNNFYSFDVEKAKELLSDAGYPDGFSFTITVPSNHAQHVDTAQVLVEQFKRIGVTANIELIEWESWLSEVNTDRNYETTVVGLVATTLTARAMLDRFHSENRRNFNNYSNPEYDVNLENALASADDLMKTYYYKECLRILTETAANVYIQDLPDFVAINKKFGGYEFYPMYIQDMAKLYIVD
ncbi:MAG: ABC transporter substrate-binding protein [Lachnospiraceae bacterium]|nr:ABC transporter substrate-binding protein [Lachnospiraceae bacterium]